MDGNDSIADLQRELAALRAREQHYLELLENAERRAAELSTVIESINDAIYMGDLQGITVANEAALQQLGFANREELNRHVAVLADEIQTCDAETGDVITAEDQPFTRALRGERVVRNVSVQHRISGEKRVVRCSASPVLVEGRVVGAVAVNTDITDQLRAQAALRESEERQAFLLKLSDTLRLLDQPKLIMQTATRLLCTQLASNRCAYYEIEDGEYVIESDSAEGVPSLVGRYPIGMFGNRLFDEHLRGQSPIVVDDVSASHDPAECESFAAIQIGAYIAVTLLKQGRFVSGLTVHSRAPRRWTANDVMMAEETAERTWAAVERAKAESALRESELRLRTVIEEAPLAMALTGPSGEILLRNPKFDELWGRPPHATTASTYSEVYEGYHLDGRPIASEEWPGARAVLNGEAIENEVYEIVQANGQRITCWFGAIPLRSASGEILGAVVVFRDITEERRTEAALRKSEERLTMAVNGAGMGTWDVDLGTGNSQWSDRHYEMLGYRPNSQNKASLEMWRSRVHPEDLAAVDTQLEHARSTGKYVSEHRIIRADDGEIRWLSEFGQVVRNETGEPYRFVGVSFDVTGRKRTEQDLLRANRDLRQFAYSASHDLREPLRTVTIFSELLRNSCGETLSPEAREHLQKVWSAARRMENLVQDLLAYAQAEMPERPAALHDAAVSLNAALANLNVAIAESKATINAGVLPALPVRAAHLQQLFQNLISNAIKFRRAGVPLVIQVSAELHNGSWHFAIADNGIGIEPEYHENIFGLFRRLHTQEKYEGTGIGLALCQRILELYDGRIWVESEFGQGSTFHFTLPA